MPDYYQLPALILTALLLPAFGYLYLRYRDARTLLWFLGFLFAIVRMLLFYKLGAWTIHTASHPWLAALSQTSIQISSTLFLASLSPLRFRFGRFQILYVIPFAIPLVLYSILFEGVFHEAPPSGLAYLAFPLLGATSVLVACFWGAAKGSMPSWLGIPACLVLGCVGIWICFRFGAGWPLIYSQCANQLLTAFLIAFVFRRISPGVVLSFLGFAAWSLPILTIFPSISSNLVVDSNLTRFIVMGKVVAAVGMILLALEDELAINKLAEKRERRARREMEAYANLVVSRRRVEDFDSQAPDICQTVAAHSCFSQVALLLRRSGSYQVAASAGIEPAAAAALVALAARIPSSGFLVPNQTPLAVEHSRTLKLDFEPWLASGDDLKRLWFTSVLAVPMAGRSGVEGALLLAGHRSPKCDLPGHYKDSLRADDLMPIEMLTSRLQATRSQTVMLEKLIDSEKFAGLGQLAGNVTQQLNDPLTVILGYASLLEDSPGLDDSERRGVEFILGEARRMKSTLDSLSRMARPQTEELAAISIAELLADMEELHRPEFLHRSIDFRLSIAPSLPRIVCRAQQIRQAVLHCLQFAIEAVDSESPVLSAGREERRTVRLEATGKGKSVHIRVAHSGVGFLHPDRAFDPFIPSQAIGETAGLGLSVCATILRDHNGCASAVNLEPSGAVIILELRAA